VAARYSEFLKDVPEIDPPEQAADCTHVFNQYVIQSKERDSIQGALKAKNIASAIYYPVPLHLQNCFKDLGYKKGDFPESERLSQQSLAIPVDPLLTDQEIERVSSAIKEAL
jgi:dTDP-4-amino-4,6-dideoxygalactose transaminase